MKTETLWADNKPVCTVNTCIEIGPYPVQKYYSIDKIELHEKKSAELESENLKPDDYVESE